MRGTWREGSFTGDPERYVSKALKMGWASVSIGTPFWGNMEGRSLLRAFERKENFLIWGNFYDGLELYAKGSCKRVSLSIGAPLGNLEGVRLPGLFERKRKVFMGSFFGPRRHEDFKSGGNLEL